MPTWVIKYAKPLLYALAAVIALVLVASIYYLGRASGKADSELRHATETIKVQKKLRKADEKIDREAPPLTDKSRSIEWLLKHTVDE